MGRTKLAFKTPVEGTSPRRHDPLKKAPGRNSSYNLRQP
jgi:hypothetical protein